MNSRTRLFEFKLKSLFNRYGRMQNINGALQAALDAELHKLSLPSGDPAFAYFAERQSAYEQMALLMEELGNE